MIVAARRSGRSSPPYRQPRRSSRGRPIAAQLRGMTRKKDNKQLSYCLDFTTAALPLAFTLITLNILTSTHSFLQHRNMAANIHVSSHPCVRAKLSILRSASTNAKETKALIHEIATIVGCQALADLSVEQSGTVSSSILPCSASSG